MRTATWWRAFWVALAGMAGAAWAAHARDMRRIERTDDLSGAFSAGVAFAKAQELARADALIEQLNRPLSDPLGHGVGGLTELEEAAFTEMVQLGQEQDVAGDLLCSVCWRPIDPPGSAKWMGMHSGWVHSMGCAA